MRMLRINIPVIFGSYEICWLHRTIDSNESPFIISDKLLVSRNICVSYKRYCMRFVRFVRVFSVIFPTSNIYSFIYLFRLSHFAIQTISKKYQSQGRVLEHRPSVCCCLILVLVFVCFMFFRFLVFIFANYKQYDYYYRMSLL